MGKVLPVYRSKSFPFSLIQSFICNQQFTPLFDMLVSGTHPQSADSGRCDTLTEIWKSRTAKPFPHNNLRTLALSCRSFFNPDPLFSITCGLFSETPGVVGGSIASGTDREGTPDETIPASVY